jgi:protease I
MAQELSGKKVAILVADGFEQVELLEPRKALDEAGAQTFVVSPAQEQVKGWDHDHWGQTLPVDRPLAGARASDYDALLLPGGVINPDKLRIVPEAVQFVREFAEQGKPIAAICHGPWILINAGLVKGRRVTSWPSLREDLRNAGADWTDETVVTDGGLVTSRKPDDIPAFNAKMIEEFQEGKHRQQQEFAEEGEELFRATGVA